MLKFRAYVGPKLYGVFDEDDAASKSSVHTNWHPIDTFTTPP